MENARKQGWFGLTFYRHIPEVAGQENKQGYNELMRKIKSLRMIRNFSMIFVFAFLVALILLKSSAKSIFMLPILIFVIALEELNLGINTLIIFSRFGSVFDIKVPAFFFPGLNRYLTRESNLIACYIRTAGSAIAIILSVIFAIICIKFF